MTRLSAVPRVSVVIPAYNNARDIRSAIESVLAQDYTDYELVVADHASTDGTSTILEDYRDLPRVRVLAPTPAGGGALANWSRVTEHARGDLLKLVCGDDLITPDALRRQVAAFDTNPDVVMVAARRNLIDASGHQLLAARGLAGLRGCLPGREAAKISILAGTNVFGEPACVMLRRDTLQEEGGWDGRFPYLIDQATYSRILMRGNFVAIPDVMASFRISAGQWSVRLTREQSQQAVAFHEHFASAHADLLSAAELRRGNRRARWMAHVRRIAYAWLRRRM
ncbi:glycosyltransferase family A protein [Luteimonas sp. TWI1416]|uniref:glycosyltransferase family A protein n=1 Tax=unclassified Luteimonas TaxID=2629088 RepID=UPI0032085F5B